MTAENTNPEQVEEVEIDVREDATVEAAQTENVSTDDELDSYSKKVSKRINKKNQQIRAAEDRAAQFEEIARQREAEINALRSQQVAQQATVLEKEEEAIKAKESQSDDLYKKAVESGDAELMSKADTLKSDISIQKEKVRLAKNRQDSTPVQPVVDQSYYQKKPANKQH